MDTYFTFENLYKAYVDCRKRKSMSFYCLEFEENLEKNLLMLEKQLQNRSYKPSRSIAFIVQKPKIREIFAADFRDRIIHHLLCSYLSPIFEKIFIYDSWACRKDKGTHKAMFRLRKFVSEIERERERERERESGLRPRLFIFKWTSKAFLPPLITRFYTIWWPKESKMRKFCG